MTTPESKAAKLLGRKGGRSKSEAKAESSRKNGKLGGRPKKNPAPQRSRGMSDTNKARRFRFVKDDDGHTYLIPAEKRADFEKWLEAGPYWEDYDGEDFQDYETGMHLSNYTFVDPIEG